MEEKNERVEDLMEKVLEHKLIEYENRLALIESEVKLMSQTAAELSARTTLVSTDNETLHKETVRRLMEFSDKLHDISREVTALHDSLQTDEKSIERIREHEEAAVSSVKKWEKKILSNLKKQTSSKKTLDALMKRFTSGKNKGKLERIVRQTSSGTKARVSLVNAVLNDKKLRAKLVNDVLAGTRGKLRKEKVTTAVANVAAKKVMKTVKPKVRKAAKSAAKKAVKTEANKA